MNSVSTTKSQEYEYYRGDRVGKGGEGVVYGGQSRSGGQRVVVKVGRLSGFRTPTVLRLLQSLQQHPSPYVCVPLECYRSYTGSLVEVYPRAEADLHEFILRRHAQRGVPARGICSIEPQEASYYVRDILRGLQHLQTLGFAHTDVKPENILMFPRSLEERAADPQAPELQCVVADFGLSRETSSNCLPPSTRRPVGAFMAPEGNYSPYRRPYSPLAADVWSLGVVLVCMLSAHGVGSVRAGGNLDSFVLHGDLQTAMPAACRNFLERCLVYAPDARSTWSRLLQCAFVPPQPQPPQEHAEEAGTAAAAGGGCGSAMAPNPVAVPMDVEEQHGECMRDQPQEEEDDDEQEAQAGQTRLVQEPAPASQLPTQPQDQPLDGADVLQTPQQQRPRNLQSTPATVQDSWAASPVVSDSPNAGAGASSPIAAAAGISFCLSFADVPASGPCKPPVFGRPSSCSSPSSSPREPLTFPKLERKAISDGGLFIKAPNAIKEGVDSLAASPILKQAVARPEREREGGLALRGRCRSSTQTQLEGLL